MARDATPEEVRAAHRSLARTYHPDAGARATDTGEMPAINDAWFVLGDPDRRMRYDHTLVAPREASNAVPPVRPRALRSMFVATVGLVAVIVVVFLLIAFVQGY